MASCKSTPEEFMPDPAIVNPLTDFEYTKDPDNAFKFHFKNLSEKYERVEWRFGDDTLRTVDDPTHIYKATGTYSVELRTFSETGSVSRKLATIVIHPDSVMSITHTPTGNPNEVELGVDVKAEVASVQWTFNDVSPAANSAELNPKRVYKPATLNTLSARVTTTDGSVVTVSRNNTTTKGFVRDITKERISYQVSAENNYSAAESSPNIVDSNIESKFVIGGRVERAFTYPFAVTLNYETAQTVSMYAIGNANDLPNRDPKGWDILGSNDGGLTWEKLDTRLMEKNFYNQRGDMGFTADADRYKKLFYFAIATPKPFKTYRLSITSNWGEATMQINDWRIYR